MKKLILLTLLTTTILFASINNNFNKEIIKNIINEYKYKLPVYQTDTITLIGIYSPNDNTIVLEYLLDFEVLSNNIEKYNIMNKETINIEKYLLSKKTKKSFINNKFRRHLNKCNLTVDGKSIFSQNLTMYFRYYLDSIFYGEFKLNKKKCEKYIN